MISYITVLVGSVLITLSYSRLRRIPLTEIVVTEWLCVTAGALHMFALPPLLNVGSSHIAMVTASLKDVFFYLIHAGALILGQWLAFSLFAYFAQVKLSTARPLPVLISIIDIVLIMLLIQLLYSGSLAEVL